MRNYNKDGPNPVGSWIWGELHLRPNPLRDELLLELLKAMGGQLQLSRPWRGT